MTVLLTHAPTARTLGPADAPRARELDLIRLAQEGSIDARNRLIENHLPMIRRLACAQAFSAGDADDLISEGALAMVRAIEGFDPTMGVRLGAYATPWITHAMRGAQMATVRMVRLSPRDEALRRKVAQTMGRVRAERGASPTPQEVALILDLPAHVVAEVLDRMRGTVFAGTEAGSELMEGAWESGQAGEPSARSEMNADRDEIASLLRTLPRGERDIVCGAFGIGCGRPKTVREMAREMSMPADQVDARLQRALSRLRAKVQAA